MGGGFGNVINSFNPFSGGRVADPLDLFGNRKEAKDASLEAEARKAEGSSGRPDDITWSSIYDPKTQSTLEDVKGQLSTIGTDRDAYNQFKGEAMRGGPSNYARMADNQQEMLAQNALDMGAQQVAGQGATARSQLAMRGGLTGGAAERLATEGQRNYLDMSQNINQQKAANLMQIGMNDEQNRISQLGQTQNMANANAGIDLQKLGMYGNAQQFDIGNQIKENQSKNDFDLSKYNSQMQAWGAAQTAAAQLRAGQGGKK